MVTYKEYVHKLFSEGRLHICRECGEHFDAKVWHCRKCNHHWPTYRNYCANCHKQGRIGSPVAALVTDLKSVELLKDDAPRYVHGLRNLKPTDKIATYGAGIAIVDEDGTYIPMCWKNRKDWARWWLRQAEINTDINIPHEERLKMMEAINDPTLPD